MRPRILTLTPQTWQAALQRRRFAVIRVAAGARGMPNGLVEGLEDAWPEGVTFGKVDLAVRHPPSFWMDMFLTAAGPMRRDGTPVAEGYYLFRDGIVIAHHPGGSHYGDVTPVVRYLRERMVDGQYAEQGRWVHEEARAQPGAGWRHSSHQGTTGGGRRQEERRAPPRPPPPGPGTGPTPYEVLGVASSCTDDELRRAYKEALKQNHPDRVAHLSPALQQFALVQTQAIRAAWEELKAKRGL